MLNNKKKLAKIERYYLTDFNFRAIIHSRCYICCPPKTVSNQYPDLNLSYSEFKSLLGGIFNAEEKNEYSQFGKILGRQGQIWNFLNNYEINQIRSCHRAKYQNLIQKLEINIEKLAQDNNFPWPWLFLNGLQGKKYSLNSGGLNDNEWNLGCLVNFAGYDIYLDKVK